MIEKCLRCGKDYEIPPRKFRFCKDCRIDFGNQTYLDNKAISIIRENKDRHIRGTLELSGSPEEATKETAEEDFA